MHVVLVNRLRGLPRKSVVRLTDRPDMTLDVYRGRKTTMQHQQLHVQVINGNCVKRIISALNVNKEYSYGSAFVNVYYLHSWCIY